MNKLNRKMTELAMIISIPEFTKEDVKPGRLKNLFNRLSTTANRELEKIPRATIVELDNIEKLVGEFGKATGWEGKPKHIITLASFCLELIEMSEFKYSPKIISILNDIVEYFENAGRALPICYWAGSVAAGKWRNIMSEA
jgi:hypothetical protein